MAEVVEQGDDTDGFIGRYGMKRVVQGKKVDGGKLADAAGENGEAA